MHSHAKIINNIVLITIWLIGLMVVPSVAQQKPNIKSALVDTTRPDSVQKDTIRLDSIQTDSIQTDSIKTVSTDLDSISFKVEVDPDTASIADEIEVRIEADYPKHLKLSEPVVRASSNTFFVKPDKDFSSRTRGDGKRDRYTFTVMPFDVGEVELPLFEFFFYDSEGNQHTRMAPITTVYIQSMLPDSAEIDSLKLGLENKDIAPLKELPILWWPYIVGGVVLILLGAFLYYFYKRKTRDFEIPEIPPEPPFDVAIRGLTELKTKNLPDMGKYKQYYSELSVIIRHYIEGRFEIKAVESTTFELKRIFKHPELNRDQIKETLDFLGRSDLIKFAKQIPPSEMPDKDYERIKNLVVSTKPVEQPLEEAEVVS
ncbi:MAG: hypothetical protein GY839_04240 [candidate division Zixibacteria bacterium]|nr:hypothetical protein [candidate division Zixibacteria bacterium]